MEPRIQYAKTEDGVNIAYRTLGEGEPTLVFMGSGLPTHIQLEAQIQSVERMLTGLAERRMVVRFDFRGFGMSERDVEGLSLETWILDLQSVVERIGLTRFALSGGGPTGPIAIAYAASNPDRVSHLILRRTAARGSDFFPESTPATEALLTLRDTNPDAFADLLAYRVGLPDMAETGRVADVFRERVTPEVARAIPDAIRAMDVLDMLPRVKSPTLIFHNKDGPIGLDVARTLAARIPDARLVLEEGLTNTAFREPEQQEEAFRVIDEFLSENEEQATAAPPALSGLVTILFTDMESSTAITQSLGDAKAQELVRAHNTMVREALAANGGAEIKHTGDGIMASFSTASSALACAVAIQKAVAARAEGQPEVPLGLRIGLNAGEPIAEEQDLFGASVQLAKRICDHAEPGQILASNVVRELSMGKGFLFGDVGEVVPKGFEEPVRLYEVRWKEDES